MEETPYEIKSMNPKKDLEIYTLAEMLRKHCPLLMEFEAIALAVMMLKRKKKRKKSNSTMKQLSLQQKAVKLAIKKDIKKQNKNIVRLNSLGALAELLPSFQNNNDGKKEKKLQVI